MQAAHIHPQTHAYIQPENVCLSGLNYNANKVKKDEQKKKDEEQKKHDEKIKEKIKEAEEKYPNKKDKVENHHKKPKYVGGDPKGETVPLPAPYHQEITNEFRNEWGYGQGKPSDEQYDVIQNKVYGKFPLPGSSPAPSSASGDAPSDNHGLVQKISNITGLTGIGLGAYIVISEGTRLFPPRNLIPIP